MSFDARRSINIRYSPRKIFAVSSIIQMYFQFLLFTLSHGDPFWHAQQQRQRYNPAIPPLPWHVVPPWEYILREIILKSVTPSPPDASTPHKRPLDASFYGGPAAERASDGANVVLSRGNVYHLLNGHWMLCQDGCVDCEPCVTQRNPLFKWILRRVKRLPFSDPPRHDLQLTIIPQTDDRLYASDLWPNSYVYVTSQGEGTPFVINGTHYDGDQNSLASLENSFSEQHHRSKNPWRLAERDDSIANRDGAAQRGDHTPVQENASTEKIEKVESPEPKHRFRNTRRRRPQTSRPVEKPATDVSTVRGLSDTVTVSDEEEANISVPKLILGIDQQGQKHLVHVVPANQSPLTPPLPVDPLARNQPVSSQFTADRSTHSNGTVPKREGQAYQRIFRRILDSLNTHRRSIENFLESSTGNVDGLAPSIDNTEVAAWNDTRDTDRTSANFERLPVYREMMGDDGRKYRRYESGYGYEGARRDVDNYYSGHRGTNLTNASRRSKEPVDSDWGRERRRTRVKSLSANSTRQDFSGINSIPRSNDSSLDAAPKLSSGSVINSARQIELNDNSVDEAFVSGNDSVDPISIATYRENGQLFNQEGSKSGEVNREIKVSHYPFGIIFTTVSPTIQREYETNRTKTL